MRFALLASVILHAVLLSTLLFVVRVAPKMRLPEKIYNVKILQPIVGSREPETTVEQEAPKPEAKKPEPAKPKPKKEAPKPKTEPEPRAEEKPLETSVQGGVEGVSSMIVDAPRFPFSYYLQAIERKVSQHWYSGVAGGAEGITCIVYFRLGRGGEVREVRIEQESGNPYFDRAALKAVRTAAPFPPLPKAFTDSELGIHFTFIQKD